jgi:carboxymethylenebutenolidase
MEKDSGPQGLWTNDQFNSLVPETPIDRRSFVAACLAAGFAVTANPVLGRPSRRRWMGWKRRPKVGDIPIYYAVKKGSGKRPVVILVAEIWGLHEYVKDTCRRL